MNEMSGCYTFLESTAYCRLSKIIAALNCNLLLYNLASKAKCYGLGLWTYGLEGPGFALNWQLH